MDGSLSVYLVSIVKYFYHTGLQAAPWPIINVLLLTCRIQNKVTKVNHYGPGKFIYGQVSGKVYIIINSLMIIRADNQSRAVGVLPNTVGNTKITSGTYSN